VFSVRSRTATALRWRADSAPGITRSGIAGLSYDLFVILRLSPSETQYVKVGVARGRQFVVCVGANPEIARARDRERHRRKRARRLELVEAEIVRRGDACQACGKRYDGNRRAFYWRRRDPSAERLDVGTLTGIGTVERLLRALSESDFVCASCHRRRESNAWSVHYTA
jgi:hypothetical protein